MKKEKIIEKVRMLQGELEQFKSSKQKEIDKFMLETGLMAFINDYTMQATKQQSKIDTLLEILKEEYGVDLNDLPVEE